MGRHDAGLVRHAELLEHLGRVPHGLPVGLAAHDDADERLRVRHDHGKYNDGGVGSRESGVGSRDGNRGTGTGNRGKGRHRGRTG